LKDAGGLFRRILRTSGGGKLLPGKRGVGGNHPFKESEKGDPKERWGKGKENHRIRDLVGRRRKGKSEMFKGKLMKRARARKI